MGEGIVQSIVLHSHGLTYTGRYRRMQVKTIDCDVGSSHPGAEGGPKGGGVHPLKRRVSWVQTVVRQVGLYPVGAHED